MTDQTRPWRFATRAIHSGQEPDPSTGSIVPPIHQSSTFLMHDLDTSHGYVYSRLGNPTRQALEQCLPSLEEGRYGLAFASGLAAETTALHLLKQGDHVVSAADVYGGTYRLFAEVLSQWGLEFTFVDATDLQNVADAMRSNTRMVWIESPTNPMLQIIDIAGIARLAHAHGALLAVDNTFASPYFQKPLTLGADIVSHSTTKYLGGHSDVIGGALILSRQELYDRLKPLQSIIGAVPGPFDAWLVLRGIKTLAVRMRQHAENAHAVARYLVAHPKVSRVHYPGLPEHPQHDLAARQMTGFGGMVSFELKPDLELVQRFLRSLRIFSMAVSLGGVESLMAHPATMTHSSVPEETRRRFGITDGLIRCSVGLEDKDDLITDLEQALAGV
ncbi:MAG: cystathionine gamma-synthase [Chloroflexota bacterium]|nr:MAG: cystathionine gamma-synthase [Chloroflexota bacterium]